MKLARWLVALLCAGVVWQFSVADTRIAPDPTTGAAAVPAGGACAQAADLMLKGQFVQGLGLLNQAGNDPAAVQAKAWTEQYVALAKQADVERQVEMVREEARVKLARVAEKYRPTLVEEKLVDPVYNKVSAMADAVAAAEKGLSLASTSAPADISKEVAVQVEKADKDLDAALQLVGSGRGDWGQAFRDTTTKFRQTMDAYVKAWQTNRMPANWRALKQAGEAMQDALIDVGILVSREPQMVALAHAREAKELCQDPEKFLQQDWVKELMTDAQKTGQQYMETGKWNEALAIFGRGALGDLDQDNAHYKDLVKQITRHVRIISIYGRAPASQPVTAAVPSTTPGAEDESAADDTRWREMLVGVDTAMVRNAISQIDEKHVVRPDYRKMSLAAMSAVRILAETPQSVNAFPTLSGKAKKDAFLEGLARQVELIRGRPTVDHLDLALTLNRVLDLNASTVAIQPEAIDMEFAEGMLDELDEFTSMIWPYEKEDFNKRTMGSFYGIGVQIRQDPGKPIEVVTPLPDTPAFRAGMMVGDLILKIDGVSTENFKLDKAVKMISGPRHSQVVLTIQRVGKPKPFELSIERDEIHIQTVKGWRAKADGKWDFMLDPQSRIGYVRVLQFTGDTADEVKAALKSLKAAKVNGVILDLRFDPGGLLPSAVDIADEFLSKGVIVKTEGRAGKSPEDVKDATPAGEYQEGNLMVLVNRWSASASEIVSGALKDWGRGVIVGERSYGKGSVQRLIDLRARRSRDDAVPQIKLTTAYYYLPSGRCLHRVNGAKVWGVDPDVAVPVTVRQTNHWSEIRQETDLLKDVNAERLNGLLDLQLREDLQLEAALLLLRVQGSDTTGLAAGTGK